MYDRCKNSPTTTKELKAPSRSRVDKVDGIEEREGSAVIASLYVGSSSCLGLVISASKRVIIMVKNPTSKPRLFKYPGGICSARMRHIVNNIYEHEGI